MHYISQQGIANYALQYSVALLLSGLKKGKTGQTGHFLSIQEVFGPPATS
jgi:hypothetical protein